MPTSAWLAELAESDEGRERTRWPMIA